MNNEIPEAFHPQIACMHLLWRLRKWERNQMQVIIGVENFVKNTISFFQIIQGENLWFLITTYNDL